MGVGGCHRCVVGISVSAFQVAMAEVTTLGYGVNDVSVGWATEIGADFDGHVGRSFLFSVSAGAVAVRD